MIKYDIEDCSSFNVQHISITNRDCLAQKDLHSVKLRNKFTLYCIGLRILSPCKVIISILYSQLKHYKNVDINPDCSSIIFISFAKYQDQNTTWKLKPPNWKKLKPTLKYFNDFEHFIAYLPGFKDSPLEMYHPQ